jgi:hypothetical protein
MPVEVLVIVEEIAGSLKVAGNTTEGFAARSVVDVVEETESHSSVVDSHP